MYTIWSPSVHLTTEEWNKLSLEQQELFITQHNIRVGYTTDISDEYQRGFGILDNNGFWEYKCKYNPWRG